MFREPQRRQPSAEKLNDAAAGVVSRSLKRRVAPLQARVAFIRGALMSGHLSAEKKARFFAEASDLLIAIHERSDELYASTASLAVELRTHARVQDNVRALGQAAANLKTTIDSLR